MDFFRGWRIRDWLAYIWAALMVVAALVSIYPGWETAWCWLGENSSTLASWFQAVGSIAAIWAGFRVARINLNEQQKFTEKRDRESIRQQQLWSLTLIKSRYKALNIWLKLLIRQAESDVPNWRHQIATADGLIAAFNALGPKDVARLDMLEPLHYADIVIRNLQARIRRFVEKEADADFIIEEMEKLHRYIEKAKKIFERELVKCDEGIFFVKGGSIWTED